MARLRYNGLTATLGADLLTAGTTITFAAALTHAAGSVPTITGSDYIPLAILNASGTPVEIVHLTAYTAGATTGTVLRAQESTTAADRATGLQVVHGPTVADLADTGWQYVGTAGKPAFTNSWTNYGGGYADAAYRKVGDRVVPRGLVKSGTINTGVFTLPAGYRPAVNTHFATSSNEAYGQLLIYSTGEVRASVGSNIWFSLNNITFYVD